MEIYLHFNDEDRNAKLVKSLCLIKHHTMMKYGEWRYSSMIFDLGTREM
jgi:hypothetical protein